LCHDDRRAFALIFLFGGRCADWPKFGELQEYIRDKVAVHPSLVEAKNKFKHLRKSKKMQEKSRDKAPETDLMRLVPDRDTCNHLVDLYFNTLGSVYPILHQPSFSEKYQRFWREPMDTAEDFVPKLLLVMATVRILSEEGSGRVTFSGLDSSLKRTAKRWIKACEAWLDQRSYKHRARSDFQIRCLLAIAKRINMVKHKEAWTRSGGLLRLGMSAGLHRNATARFKQVQPFDFEMRQRLWSFIKLWDLKTTIECGMPMWVGATGSEDPGPTNISDNSFGKDSESVPLPQPRNTFTSASYMRIAEETYALRSSIAIAINTAKTYMPYTDVLAYDAQITSRLHSLPQWTSSPDLSTLDRPKAILPQFLLENDLRQIQLMLHRPCMRIAARNPRYTYSRTICLETATAILDKLVNLPPDQRSVAAQLGPDLYRATFTLCHSLYVSSIVRIDQPWRATHESLSVLICQAISVLEEKILREGSCLDQHWLLLSAYFFLRTTRSPERLAEHLQCMVDRVTWIYNEIVQAQEEPLLEAVPSAPDGGRDGVGGGGKGKGMSGGGGWSVGFTGGMGRGVGVEGELGERWGKLVPSNIPNDDNGEGRGLTNGINGTALDGISAVGLGIAPAPMDYPSTGTPDSQFFDLLNFPDLGGESSFDNIWDLGTGEFERNYIPM